MPNSFSFQELSDTFCFLPQVINSSLSPFKISAGINQKQAGVSSLNLALERQPVKNINSPEVCGCYIKYQPLFPSRKRTRCWGGYCRKAGECGSFRSRIPSSLCKALANPDWEKNSGFSCIWWWLDYLKKEVVMQWIQFHSHQMQKVKSKGGIRRSWDVE